MIRRYTFKLCPDAAQTSRLDEVRLMHQQLYNAALQERMDCYRLTGETRSLYDQQRSITQVRRDDPAYAALSSDSLHLTAKRLDQAFRHFFRRAKSGAGAHSGFPRFKAARFYPGFDCRENGKGWKMIADPDPKLARRPRLAAKRWQVRFKGVDGWIAARGKFPAPPKDIRGCAVKLHAGTWWISVVVDIERDRRHGAGRARVDWDLNGFVVTEIATEGRCAPSASAGIVPQPSGSFVGESAPSRDSPCGDPDIAGQPQGRLSAPRLRRACGDPDIAGQPQENLLRERRYVACGDPDIAGQPQVAWVEQHADMPCGDPDSAGQPQGTVVRAMAEPPQVRQMAEPPQGARQRPEAPEAAVQSHVQREGRNASADRTQEQITGVRADNSRVEAVHRDNADNSQATIRTNGTEQPQAHPQPLLDKTQVFGERIAALQRKIARCKRGSARRQRLGQLCARHHARQARRRHEAQHRFTTALIARYEAITMVTGDLLDLTRSGHGTPRRWGAAVDLKAAVNRHIRDLAPGAIAAMLAYKAEEAGGAFEEIHSVDHPAAVGNEIVAATIANRALRRAARHA